MSRAATVNTLTPRRNRRPRVVAPPPRAASRMLRLVPVRDLGNAATSPQLALIAAGTSRRAPKQVPKEAVGPLRDQVVACVTLARRRWFTQRRPYKTRRGRADVSRGGA